MRHAIFYDTSTATLSCVSCGSLHRQRQDLGATLIAVISGGILWFRCQLDAFQND